MARLVLVGLPGTGKSRVAKQLAARWGVGSLDTDDLVAAAAGCDVGAYLREMGEPEFRRRELEALLEALDTDSVVATGGGVVTIEEARKSLVREPTYWLDSTDEEILHHVGDVDRPLLGDRPAEALARLRAQRETWYREVSRARVESSGTLDEVVERVLDEMKRTLA